MNIKLLLPILSSSLVLCAPGLRAHTTDTNNISLGYSLKYQQALEEDRALGERALLPPGLKEKMRLSKTQRSELKPFEEDFANTSEEYEKANQPRIDAAREANRQARVAKDSEQIHATRKQLHQVWAGLQPYRDTAVVHIKPLLTPVQLAILEDEKNQWREENADPADDPSEN